MPRSSLLSKYGASVGCTLFLFTCLTDTALLGREMLLRYREARHAPPPRARVGSLSNQFVRLAPVATLIPPSARVGFLCAGRDRLMGHPSPDLRSNEPVTPCDGLFFQSKYILA